MACIKCGGLLAEGVRFCKHCGAEQPVEAGGGDEVSQIAGQQDDLSGQTAGSEEEEEPAIEEQGSQPVRPGNQCVQCGGILANDAQFCKHCGAIQAAEADISVGQMFNENEQATMIIEMPVVEAVRPLPIASQVRHKSSKLSIALSILCALLVVAGVVAYIICAKMSSPEAAAKVYFDSLGRADYKAAYNCLSIPANQEFFSEDAYIKAMQQTYGDTPWIDNMTVKNVPGQERDAFTKNVDVNYIMKGDGAQRTDSLILLRSNKKVLLFFDEWKVSVDNIQMDQGYAVNVPKGASLMIDGVEIGDRYVTDGFSMDQNANATYQTYTIPKMFSFAHDVTATMPGGVMAELATSDDGKGAAFVSFTPDENLKNKLSAIITKYADSYMKAVYASSLSPVQSKIVASSPEHDKDSDAILNEYANKDSTLKNVTSGEVDLDDATHARIYSDETYANQVEQWDYFTGYYNSQVDNTENKIYYLEKSGDDWLVYDHESN